MSLITPRKHSRMDVAGMALSFICLLHCLLLPVMVVYGVLASDGDGSRDWTHVIMLAIILPVSGIALAGGWIRHRRADVLRLGLLSIVLLTFSALVAHDYLGHTFDAVLTTIGGALLALAHWRNRDCGCPSAVQRRATSPATN